MDKRTISILDGNHWSARAFFALHLSDSKGRNTSVIYGVLDMLNTYIDEHPNDSIVVCWDTSRSKNRTDILSTYKYRRDPKDEAEKASRSDWINQMGIVKEELNYLGVTQVMIEGYEGDELIAGVIKLVNGERHCQIVTSDKDLLQCVNENVSWYDAIKRKTVTKDNFDESIGIKREDFLLYKCLIGDSGDDVPGIRGIGEVRAKQLLTRYHTIDELSNNFSKDKAGQLVFQKKDILERNKRLVDVNEFITEDILKNIEVQLDRAKTIDIEKFLDIAHEYDMYSLIDKIEELKVKYQQLLNRGER
jgi:DNA polymerase-1